VINFSLTFITNQMKKTLLFCAVLFYCTNLLLSQKNEFEIRNQDITEFPLIKGNLWVKNPSGIEISSVNFSENDVPLDVTFKDYTLPDSLSKNKSVLFLVLNSPRLVELNWYKNVIKESIKKGAIFKGDKIEILSFSCKKNDQLLFPNSIQFTDNADQLFKDLDAIKTKDRSGICGDRSHIYLAINEALELYEKQNLNMPSAIFLLADDCALNPNFVFESPGLRSRRLNIPIYGISYFKTKTYFDIEDLCKKTYGLYYSNKNNDIKESSEQLVNFLKDICQRHSGVLYPFAYTSTFDKDGESHLVKIKTKEGESGFMLLTPTKNIIEWIASNLILSLLFFIIVTGLVIYLFQIIKKNNLKKIELENNQKKQMSAMERQQSDADLKMMQQESELNRIREEEKQKSEKELQFENEKIQKKSDDEQLRKMLERGNLPWFEYSFGQERGQYQIESPRFKVGRDGSNNWAINHPTVSRNHFLLSFKDYVYIIKDVGSSNGLEVNGVKINEIQLKHGDHIQVGDISLTFHI